MSDPEVPDSERKSDVDDVVDSANAGLAKAEAARADVSAASDDVAAIDYDAVDPALAAFEAAERDHPGTFAATQAPSGESREAPPTGEPRDADAPQPGETRETDAPQPPESQSGGDRVAEVQTRSARRDEAVNDVRKDDARKEDNADTETAYLPPAASTAGDDAETRRTPLADDTKTRRTALTDDAETQVVPSEPLGSATDAFQQPIFVQAPEPPRERGNRGAAGGIGLLATIVFAILYLATMLGLGALRGDVTTENIGEAALAPLTTLGFWTPVAAFFIGFWFLGAIINRGRWGLWVVFGIIVGLFAYAGHILGQLFEAPFWQITAREGGELVASQLLTPLAIAAFVFGRELTIWFGAWVARSGARKTALNEAAQLEYERTIEAGPSLSR